MNSYSYSDDTASRQRHHAVQHGFPPAMDANYPPPTMTYLHDQGGGGGQHVSPNMAPATSAFDMSGFAVTPMQHMYQPAPSMYNDSTQHGYTDPTYASYSQHDATTRSNHHVVDRDLHFLATPSTWQSLHHSTASSDSSSFPLSSPPTSYQDAMPHHPATTMHTELGTSSSAMPTPQFAPPSSTRHSSTHPGTSGDHTAPYAGFPYSTNAQSSSFANRSPHQAGHPTSFHTGAPSATAVATATAAEPRSSSVSSTADPLDNKKEKRKSQVRDASRRRRAKRKDEETRLRDRIQELTHQIQIMGGGSTAGGDGARPGPDAPDQDDAALEEAYQQQLQVVHMLQQKNLQYKEKLAQHEQFARLIQTGIQHLTDDSTSTAPQLQLLQQQQMLQLMPGTASAVAGALSPAGATGASPPNLVATPALAALLGKNGGDSLTRWAKAVSAKCHRDLQVSIGDSSASRSSPPNVTTNVAMGWKTQLWMGASPRVVHTRSHKVVAGANSPECAEKTWEILTSSAKGRRVYPDLKAIEVVKEVISNELVVAIYRKSTTHVVDGRDRDTVSVVYKAMDPASGKLCFMGVASFDDAALGRGMGQNAPNEVEPVESYGWSFASDESVVFQGRYTVHPTETASIGATSAARHPDLIMTQYSNETMFALVRWESEAIGPVFRIDQA